MRFALRVVAPLLIGAAPFVVWGDPAPGSPEQIVAHHMASAAKGDVDGIVADYADNAVIISPAGKTQGKADIRKMFAGIFGGPGPHAAMDVKQQFYTREIGYVAWVQSAGKPEELHGSDTFVVRKGKIIAQTVALVPMHPPAK
jgi:ketosteroid isomerase-like protein